MSLDLAAKVGLLYLSQTWAWAAKVWMMIRIRPTTFSPIKVSGLYEYLVRNIHMLNLLH